MKAQCSPHTQLKDFATLRWLKKRYGTNITQEYLYNESERQRWVEIQDIFSKFDTDGSGTLDMRELYKLLKKSQLAFKRKNIVRIFKILDADGSQYVTVDEFQQLTQNDRNLHKFRQVMREVRKETIYESFNRDKNSKEDEYSSFIPLTFESLLDYLYKKQMRE